MVLPQYVVHNVRDAVAHPFMFFFSLSFDVGAWIKTNALESDKNKSSASGPGLKIAGAEGARKEDEGIGVMMAMDKDEMTQRQERDAQAEIKRQQNAMPAWHLKSTITGELTALGIKENAREVASVVNGTDQLSNDNILKGLGVIGGGSSRTTGGQGVSRVPVVPAPIQEDVKPVINAESDRTYFFTVYDYLLNFKFIPVYDQYYASLAAAASAMSSGQPTPTATAMGSSVANSPIFSMFSSRLHDEEEDDEDEDRKPNVEYLDSLNAYRKRSRSSEDVGQPSKVKATKLDNVNGNGNGYLLNGYGHRNGSSGSFEDDRGPPSSQDTLIESLPEETKSLDDPICYGWCLYLFLVYAAEDWARLVAGEPKAYSHITDEDHELMTPEEYTTYFEIFQARSEG